MRHPCSVDDDGDDVGVGCGGIHEVREELGVGAIGLICEHLVGLYPERNKDEGGAESVQGVFKLHKRTIPKWQK